jgi:hypothetical protein
VYSGIFIRPETPIRIDVQQPVLERWLPESHSDAITGGVIKCNRDTP